MGKLYYGDALIRVRNKGPALCDPEAILNDRMNQAIGIKCGQHEIRADATGLYDEDELAAFIAKL